MYAFFGSSPVCGSRKFGIALLRPLVTEAFRKGGPRPSGECGKYKILGLQRSVGMGWLSTNYLKHPKRAKGAETSQDLQKEEQKNSRAVESHKESRFPKLTIFQNRTCPQTNTHTYNHIHTHTPTWIHNQTHTNIRAQSVPVEEVKCVLFN